MGRPLKKSILNVIFIHPFDDSARLITKQKGFDRYECLNHGTSVFTLADPNQLTAGHAFMLAYDSAQNVYFVTKLTRHHAVVHRFEQNGSNAWQFADPSVYPKGQIVKWYAWNPPVAYQTVIPEFSL